MKKANHKIRRASLKERLHFLFTGEIPNYWYKANMDVRITLLQALADPEFPYCKANKDKPEMLKNIIDFLGITKFSYESIEKYVFRQPLLPYETKFSLKRLFFNDPYPDYFPKPNKP